MLMSRTSANDEEFWRLESEDVWWDEDAREEYVGGTISTPYDSYASALMNGLRAFSEGKRVQIVHYKAGEN